MVLNAAKKMGVMKRAVAAVDYLSGLHKIAIRLENGRTELFDAAAELRIPVDADAQAKAAMEAPAKYAFWSYQASRVLRRVRLAEIKLAQLEGKKQVTWRFTWMDIHANREKEREEQNPSFGGRKDPFISESLIRAGADMDEDVIAARKELTELRANYDTLRSVRDAAEHRLYVLRKLLGQKEDIAD